MDFQEQFDKAINKYAQGNTYGVSLIPSHAHTGKDSQQVDISNIARFPSNPSNGDSITFSTATNQWIVGSGSSFAIGNGVRPGVSGSGSESITGLGFKPKLIIFFSGTNGNGSICNGAARTSSTGTITNQSSEVQTAAGLLSYNVDTSKCIIVRIGANVMTASITSFDSDGFTFSWTSPGNFFSVDYTWEAFS